MSLLKVAGTTASSGTLYVNDVFSTWLYTGNGSTQTINNGIDLAGKGGLVWLKSRSAATDHKLTDTTRGATKALISNTTGAETTDTTGLTAFNSTGFSLGANSTYNMGSSRTFVSWTFREAAKFFDVVTYTGNGTNQTIAHSLGVTPGMIIVKRRNSADIWPVWHRSLPSATTSPTGLILLNLSDAATTTPNWFEGTQITSASFMVNDNTGINASGGTYVAYLFAHDTSSTGIIQCGSFTTSATLGVQTTVTLGWEPQFVILKSTQDENWVMLDSMRGMTVKSADAVLNPNLSAAEDNTSYDFITPTATGFYVKAGTGVSTNATYIYMAIRRPNKPPTTGTQVFSPVYTSSASVPLTVTTNFPVDLTIITASSIPGQVMKAIDRLRGAQQTSNTNYLEISSTSAEIQVSSPNGIGLDSNVSIIDNMFSGGSNPKIYWNFARAPGFFDEVCYTGTGSATTQAHNLGAVPELMIVKERSAANDWWVYMSSVGNTKYSVLNSTAIPATSATAWNNTTPTASVFSIGTGANVNASAQTFVAYLFATLAGISKVGSYTGNGTGQAIACGFSAGARFVLIKRTDSTGNWYTFDSARGLTSGSSPYLLLNSTAAEVTGNNGVYASTGGFTLGSTAITTTNIATATYIFLAVS